MQLYAVHRCHQSLYCQCFWSQFRLIEPLRAGQMLRVVYVSIHCGMSKDFCRLTWCHASLFGISVWSCHGGGGPPPGEYIGQMLVVSFRALHHEHLRLERWLEQFHWDVSFFSKPDDSSVPCGVLCFADPDCLDLLPVASACSEIDGW